MFIRFYGATGCVTGSCHILNIGDKTILLDCGLFQGKDEKEIDNTVFSFNPKEIDYVLLSHAHIDHSGRIPLLYKQGFKGEVICTNATKDLCSAMLPDSGYIQEMEVEWRNRKRLRQGLNRIEPLYTAKLAEISLYLFKGYDYDELIELFPGCKVRFRNAGHLLGAAIIELFVKEESKEEVKIVFTGDLGNNNLPLIKDPEIIDYADYVLMETTYGNRYHDAINDQINELVSIIKDTFKRGGNVVIPSFAVGRTQEVLYALNRYIDDNELEDIKVFVDSPLATKATKIFKDYENYYDEEAVNIVNHGEDPLKFDGLVFTESVEDSSKINDSKSGAIIISASGMCEAGRIRHHLKHNLWRPECSIVFVGYQAEGTLGKSLLNGIKKVKLFGEEIAVNAHIHNLNGLSGHADRQGLLNWLERFHRKPKEVILIHGDDESRESFKELIQSRGFNARIAHKEEKYFIGEALDKSKIDFRDEIIKFLYSTDINNLTKEDLLKNVGNIFDKSVDE